MLPKKHRLSLRTELKIVKKDGRLYRGEFFSLLLSQQAEEGSLSRFAFIVSKKIHRKAVGRNRIRRLLTASVSNLLPDLKPGFDGVFLVKREILNKKLPEINGEVTRVFTKANLLEEKQVV